MKITEKTLHADLESKVSVDKDGEVDVPIEISKLKGEAIRLLDDMLGVPEGFHDMRHDRFVECILSASILEISDLMKAVRKG